ncbi:MAG: adenosylcobinamide-phosphate synthase CbiB [Desulfocapsaceae bacterium]|nr:adenosylcobinamide-phosphate synthase CbiB [Desulfocapsaceae bacterium]
MYFEMMLALALIGDQLAGDPRWFPHPVRMIGWLCLRLEGVFRSLIPSKGLAGFFTLVSIIAITVGCAGMLIGVAASFAPLAGDIIAVLLLYTAVAARDLSVHSLRVYTLLCSGDDIVGARKAVAMIVGRDTDKLDEAGISRACVETVAENMVDGVTAPLFFGIFSSLFASFGGFSAIGCAAVGAIAYKAINTMDSMFGYKNEKYLEFGWAAARLDDVANFIPARLSGLAVILAAFILRHDWRGAARIFFRDRLRHSSPNSAHTEAAVAGALGVQLGGNASYFGTLTSKPTIGDSNRAVKAEDIMLTGRIMQVGALVFVILLLLARRIIVGL